MPWREYTCMSERLEFVAAAGLPGASMTALCRAYGVSRKTGYKWLARASKGLDALDSLSRRPNTSPRQTSVEMEALICEMRRIYRWGGRKIHFRLLADGHTGVPAASSISAILRRNGLLERSPRPQRDYLRFEEAQPNALWQMDFKGHFATQQGRCHPLTVTDDHSRFNLCLAACPNERGETVKAELTRVFRLYGLPDRMLMDNGSPWGHDRIHQQSYVTAWLIRLGTAISHGRPYHPQTQGKEERFHRTLKHEVLSRQSAWQSLAEVQAAFDNWRTVYNLYRPHQALGDLSPGTRYRPSERDFPESLPAIEYLDSDVVRMVSHRGAISFKGRRFFISEAFNGEPVALRVVGEGKWNVYYCHQQIAALDLTVTP
jgi:transposase InsO family protein